MFACEGDVRDGIRFGGMLREPCASDERMMGEEIRDLLAELLRPFAVDDFYDIGVALAFAKQEPVDLAFDVVMIRAVEVEGRAGTDFRREDRGLVAIVVRRGGCSLRHRAHASIERPFPQDMKRRLITFITSLVALAAIGVGLIVTDHPAASVTAKMKPPASIASAASSTIPTAIDDATSTNALVTHVVDGDTFDVQIDGETQTERVRMLGIDTPETVDPRKTVQCFGKEASNHAKELLMGKRVRLEADPKADEHDKYGRILRNVYLVDGTDVNATLVLDGYAHAYLTFPLDRDRKRLLSDLQNEARDAQRGLWDPAVCPPSS